MRIGNSRESKGADGDGVELFGFIVLSHTFLLISSSSSLAIPLVAKLGTI